MADGLIYGLHDLEEYADSTLDVIGTQDIEDRVAAFQAAHNENYMKLFSSVARTDPRWNTAPVFRYQMPTAVDMQYVDEDGVVPPVKGRSYYERGLPLFRREIANGDTWEALRVKTVRQLSKDLMNVQLADVTSGHREMLRALFYPTSWTYKTPEEPGSENFPATITVQPLANGDTETYILRGGSTSTADHYNGQANAVADGADDPFQAIYDRLTLYSPIRKPRIVSFFNGATLTAAIRALTSVYFQSNTRYVAYGTNTAMLSDSIETDILFGDEVVGEHESGVVLVRDRDLPDNYIVSLNLDAPALGMRQSGFPQLQGLYQTTMVGAKGNEILRRWRRQLGFGAVERTGADVLLIGNGTYSAPTNFGLIG